MSRRLLLVAALLVLSACHVAALIRLEVPPLDLDEGNFFDHIKDGTVVTFYSPTCPACKHLKPVLRQLAYVLEMTDVTVGQLDCTANSLLCQRMGVKSYPTIQYFQNGALYHTYSGARKLPSLVDWLARYEKQISRKLRRFQTWYAVHGGKGAEKAGGAAGHSDKGQQKPAGSNTGPVSRAGGNTRHLDNSKSRGSPRTPVPPRASPSQTPPRTSGSQSSSTARQQRGARDTRNPPPYPHSRTPGTASSDGHPARTSAGSGNGASLAPPHDCEADSWSLSCGPLLEWLESRCGTAGMMAAAVLRAMLALPTAVWVGVAVGMFWGTMLGLLIATFCCF